PYTRGARSSGCRGACWPRAVAGCTASPNRFRPRHRLAGMELITNLNPPESPARVNPPEREPLRVGLVQHRWHPDPDEHRAALAEGVRMAAAEGARLVCLQELTLSPYFAIAPDGPRAGGVVPEDVPAGPTCTFAGRLARETGAH